MQPVATPHNNQTAYQPPAQMDALFKTQPLAQLLGRLRTRTAGLFKIESVHLPRIVVDAAAGKAYVATAGHVPAAAYGDLMVSARNVAHLPDWVSTARVVPFMHMLWVAAESATLAPVPYGDTQRFALTHTPDVPYGPQYKYTTRMAALCATQPLTFSGLVTLAGVSALQAQRFLQACAAVGCLRVEEVGTPTAAPVANPAPTNMLKRMRAMLAN
jgi:hypothetical protein